MAGSLQVCFDLSISQDGLSVGTPDVLHETICVIDVDLAISDCLLESYLAPPEVIEIQASVGDRIASRYRTPGMGSREIIPGRLKTAREELTSLLHRLGDHSISGQVTRSMSLTTTIHTLIRQVPGPLVLPATFLSVLLMKIMNCQSKRGSRMMLSLERNWNLVALHEGFQVKICGDCHGVVVALVSRQVCSLP